MTIKRLHLSICVLRWFQNIPMKEHKRTAKPNRVSDPSLASGQAWKADALIRIGKHWREKKRRRWVSLNIQEVEMLVDV